MPSSRAHTGGLWHMWRLQREAFCWRGSPRIPGEIPGVLSFSEVTSLLGLGLLLPMHTLVYIKSSYSPNLLVFSALVDSALAGILATILT